MKKVLHLVFGVGILAMFLTTPAFSQISEISVPGCAFTPSTNIVDYTKWFQGYIYVGSPSQLNCPVYFPESANGKQVTRLSFTFLDNNVGGTVSVSLYKLDRWSGQATPIGRISSNEAGASPDIMYRNIPKSYMSARGIDNNRYAWYLYGYMSDGGDSLRIYQVTIRYE